VTVAGLLDDAAYARFHQFDEWELEMLDDVT
jgi:hypothetical protein